jgi:phosphomannomutase/phosphoglucomutase
MINPFIFREYDIRGIVDKDLTDDTVDQIGRAFATYLHKHSVKKITVGGDVRLSTKHFKSVIINSLRSSGIDTIDIGIIPTPVQYFSMVYLKVDGGLMITASHNPAEFNGFKLTVNNDPVYGEEIQKILQLIEKKDFITTKNRGNYEKIDVIEPYIDYIKKNIKIARPMKVVLDSGNGAASLVAHRLFKELGMTTVNLFDTPDGTFPHHHPDPTVAKNIQELIKMVKESKADAGFGYDGDGDRIGVVDENGEIIWGDRLLIIFAREILKQYPKANIIFEVKCSQTLPEMIKKLGGRPIMWKTGHSLIKKKMKETGAPLAGEMSGHLFFADRYFGFDDAIYASVRMTELLSKTNLKLSQLLTDAPVYYATPEIRAEASSDEEKFKIARKAKDYFSKNFKVIDIDGVRILFGDGWALVRASNTQPVIVLRFEANTPKRLDEIKNLVVSKLKEFGEITI